MKKWFLGWIMIFIANFTFSNSILAEEYTAAAKHVIAVDVQTGKILYAKDADTKTYIASITKLLTAYLVYEAIDKGEIAMNTPVEISDYPYELTTSGVSNVYLEARNYTVQELLNASMITSANSAAIALAEKIAGSEPEFVDQMLQKLKEWGIQDAKIVNVTGLNNDILGDNKYPGSGKNDENMMSATDVATVARRLILDYPQVLEITSQYAYQFEGNTYLSTNQMLKGGTYERAGVDGLKTGTTELSGASFVATMKAAKMRIITVVLNADDGEKEPDNRFIVTNDLLDYIVNKYTTTPIIEAGKQYENSEVSVFNGQEKQVKAVGISDYHVVVENGKEEAVSASFVPKQDVVDAPVQKNHSLGSLQLKDTNLIGKGYLDQLPEMELVAKKDIPAANWPVSWWNHFVRYVNENL